MKKTDLLTANVRRETIPGLTSEEYLALLDGKNVKVESKKAAEYLISSGLATEKGDK